MSEASSCRSGKKAPDRPIDLIEAVILMAHKLGISVIGEGVENEGQQQILLDSRCDFQQGYLFSHPLPEAEFLERFASA